MSRFQGLFEVLKVVAVVFVVTIVIRIFLIQPFVVEGSSMEPDFHDHEYVLIEKISYRFHTPSRGDVIVFRYPNNPSVNYIKRVIGLPGETIHIENGLVSINGRQLSEAYLASGEKTFESRNTDQAYETKLSADQFFVMGDNREHSSDSRDWGPLKRNFIIGRSVLVLYPTKDFQAIASPKY